MSPWCRPVEEKETRLQHRGPKWRTATMTEVLHNLPFLRHAPRRVVEVGSPCSLNLYPLPLVCEQTQ